MVPDHRALSHPPGKSSGKGRFCEPKSPSEQNSRLRVGIEKETGGVTLPLRAPAPRQFPLRPYRLRKKPWAALRSLRVTAPPAIPIAPYVTRRYESDIGAPTRARRGTAVARCTRVDRLPKSLRRRPWWGISLTAGEEKRPPSLTVML